MALTVTEAVLDEALDLAAQAATDPNKIADAWRVLADAGDVYAASAATIISERDDPQSLFARIVRVQWDRVVGAEVRASKFTEVGLTHLINYLTFIGNDLENRLPNTEFIEQSYRNAVAASGLPPLIAVDSMYSLLDLRLEQGYLGLESVQDVSWAFVLHPGLEPARIVFDSEVFADQVFDPFEEILSTAWEFATEYPLSGFCPDFTDTSEKANNWPGGVSCQSGENSVPSLNGKPSR